MKIGTKVTVTMGFYRGIQGVVTNKVSPAKKDELCIKIIDEVIIVKKAFIKI